MPIKALEARQAFDGSPASVGGRSVAGTHGAARSRSSWPNCFTSATLVNKGVVWSLPYPSSPDSITNRRGLPGSVWPVSPPRHMCLPVTSLFANGRGFLFVRPGWLACFCAFWLFNNLVHRWAVLWPGVPTRAMSALTTCASPAAPAATTPWFTCTATISAALAR